MSGASRQFDDHWLHERMLAARCERVLAPCAKALAASEREHARAPLRPETLALLERAWTERVTPATGLPSFAAMAAALAEDHAAWASRPAPAALDERAPAAKRPRLPDGES